MDNYTIEYIDIVPITVNEGTQSFVFEEIQVFNIIPTETIVVNSSTSALNSFIQVATRDIGGLRVLLADQSYADQFNIDSYGKVIGLSKGAVVTGGLLEIVTASELAGFTGLIPNTQVYLGLNGLITQTVPTSGFIQQLGVALTSTTILVNISLPFLLS
jgi:hypothetical protein